MVAPAPKPGDPLTRGGTTAGRLGQIVTAANRWRENYNPIRRLTMRRVVELFELAQRGDTAYLQWTFRFVERRYPILSALITKCEGPLMGFDWQVKIKTELPPGATDAMAHAQKQTLTDAYTGVDNLQDAIKFLALADFRGYSHLQKHYSPDGDVVHLECLNQWCVCRDGLEGNWFWNPDSRSTSEPLRFLGKDFCIGGEALPLGDFIIREIDRPVDEIGLVNFVRASLAEKDWDGFLEIYGIPGGVVTMPGNVPPGKETEYEAAARQVAEGGSGAIPNGSEYKPNDGPRGVDPFSPRLKHLDEQVVLAGTGSKLTMLAERGSGTLAGSAHSDTFKEIAGDRAGQISACFQRQFDAAILSREHPGEPALVYFELAAKEETDISALVKDVVALYQADKIADTAWLNEKTGYQMEDAPEPAAPVAPPNLPTAPVPPKPGEKPVVKNRAATSQSLVAKGKKSFAAATADDLSHALDRLARILKISDDDLFLKKLQAFTDDFPALKDSILADPAGARALEPILGAALANGLANKPETAAA